MIGVIFDWLHLIEFAILYLFIILAFLVNNILTRKTNHIALAIAVLYSFIDELHQYFVPYRTAAWNDIIKNNIGIFMTWYIVTKFNFQKKRIKAYYDKKDF